MTGAARLVVHLVHGTFAEDAPWTRPHSPFRERLEALLREKHGIEAEIDFSAPRWGGANRHSERMAGAEMVRRAVRETNGSGTPGVRQVLIGHSHGGNVCLQASRDGRVAGSLDGVVCLATPFLVFRPAHYPYVLYMACWVAWWMAAMFAAMPFVGGPLLAMLVSLPVAIAFFAYYAWVHGDRGFANLPSISAPPSIQVPTLLIRCPGDEASGALGMSLILERLLVVVASKVASVWGWIDRHKVIVVLLGLPLVAAAVAAATWGSLELSGSTSALKGPALVVGGLFVALGVVPLLLGFPLRMLLIAASYGHDVAVRAPFLTVTAETTPPGSWSVHTVFPQPNHSDLPRMAHSEPYGNPEAIDAIARFVGERIGAR